MRRVRRGGERVARGSSEGSGERVHSEGEYREVIMG